MTTLNRTLKCALCYLRCVGSSTTAVIAAVALLLPMSRPAAATVICQQECAGGTCAQAGCGRAVTGGFSHCAGGWLSWEGATYSSWCVAWGSSPPPLVPGQAVHVDAGAAAAPLLPHPEAMMAAARSANPWVATLLAALQDGTRWAEGPVQGLLHDSEVDATRRTDHSVALPFAGQATRTLSGALQIDIRVSGDFSRLPHLERQAPVSSPPTIPANEIHGSVTAGGMHGALLVSAADGRSQTIQW